MGSFISVTLKNIVIKNEARKWEKRYKWVINVINRFVAVVSYLY